MTPLPTPTTPALWRRQLGNVQPDVDSLTCFAYRISQGGEIVFNDFNGTNGTTTVPLLQDATLFPDCDDSDGTTRQVIDLILDVRDPFYASNGPIVFVLAICLTVAWVLLIMLMVTPRTFFHTGAGYGLGNMRTSNAGGSIPIVGIGNRPWFQKVATLTVAVSLLVATVQTFDVIADQYNQGYEDSVALILNSAYSNEVQIVRFISTVFEWLAQAQTSLRLFQRHREKVAIKWVALSLIALEMVFAILNTFTSLGEADNVPGSETADQARRHPHKYANAIPALQYLFELALSLLYAAVVFYYSLNKRRFAYYHSSMKNISLVAFLSIVAVIIPVVFFVLDVACPQVSFWGDYVRWVGSAAASVIVWEWVERIEALEREERKDGILGREIFEGDDMLDDSPGPDGLYSVSRRRLGKTASASTTMVASSRDSGSGITSLKRRGLDRTSRFPRLDKGMLAKIAILRTAARKSKGKRPESSEEEKTGIELQEAPRVVRRQRRNQPHDDNDGPDDGQVNGGETIQPPQVTPSPISRSDCTSASTVYRVVHHPISPTSTPGISETLYPQGNAMNISSPSPDATKGKKRQSDLVAKRAVNIANLNPFKRRGNAKTPETLATATDDRSEKEEEEEAVKAEVPSRSGFLSRFRRNVSEEGELPPLVIPWRGDESASTPQDADLEAGMGADDPYNNATDIWSDPYDHEEHTPNRSRTTPARNSQVNAEPHSPRRARGQNRHHDFPSDER